MNLKLLQELRALGLFSINLSKVDTKSIFKSQSSWNRRAFWFLSCKSRAKGVPTF